MNTKKQKVCKTWEGFMRAVGGLTMKQAKNLGIDMSCIEEDNGYAAIFACYSNQVVIDQIMKKYNLYVATLTITDVDDGEISCVYSYESGFHMVDRERWLLCKKDVDAIYIEEIEEF